MLVLSFGVNSALAAGTFVMHGTADENASYATILVLEKGTVFDEIKSENIKYVNQSRVNDDGSFSFVFPILDDEFDVYSNMGEFNVSDGEEKTETVYVSSTGSDSNDGSEEKPYKTLAKAYEKLLYVGEIILLDETAYEEVPAHTGNLTIKGKTNDVVLKMPATVTLSGDLTIDNVITKGKSTIYANGYKLVIGNGVTTDAPALEDRSQEERLSVYGGANNGTITGDTDIQLYGGKYYRIYGGGYKGTVNGNTNVIVGGNVNTGDGIDDDNKTTFSPCYVYGGSNNGPVTGETNITVQDSAVIGYMGGAGAGASGTAAATNININGGSVMNVYGGSLNAELSGIVTNINMRGGTVEALFGGSQGKSMSGHTNINVYGGEVTRRIYSGCYNGYSSGWSSDYYVNGTTFLGLHTASNMITSIEADSGIFCGSRANSNHSEEHNTLAYLDNCYSSANSKIGKKNLIPLNVCSSHHDYTVIANAGGNVTSAKGAGTINLVPDKGYDAYINNQIMHSYTIASGATANVTFTARPFNINGVDASKGEASVTGTADITANNTTQEPEPKLFIVVYDADTMEMLACDMQDAVTGKAEFNLPCTFEANKKYLVKAMMWNGNMKPLSSSYYIDLK